MRSSLMILALGLASAVLAVPAPRDQVNKKIVYVTKVVYDTAPTHGYSTPTDTDASSQSDDCDDDKSQESSSPKSEQAPHKYYSYQKKQHHHNENNSPESKPTTSYYVPKSSPTPDNTQPSSGNGPDYVSLHNKLRALHHAGPLEYDPTIASVAQDYANTCSMQHSGGKYGENLCMGYKDYDSCINDWYAEGTKYDYAAGQFSHECGHFTQMVWLGAKKIGCGIANCPGNTYSTFIVCNYDTGNIIGYFKDNVLPE